jgi:hypothetical protein
MSDRFRRPGRPGFLAYTLGRNAEEISSFLSRLCKCHNPPYQSTNIVAVHGVLKLMLEDRSSSAIKEA